MEKKSLFLQLIESIIRWFSKHFGSSTSNEGNGMDFSKYKSIELPKDFKETVGLSDVVAYFKGLSGKIKQGEDTPFVAFASSLVSAYPALNIENPESSLLLATYNEKSEEVENVLVLEFNVLGETLKNALSQSKNGIVTLS